MLCSRRGARPRRRPRRHPDPAAGTASSGRRSSEALGVDADVVFDLEITRNRPDACRSPRRRPRPGRPPAACRSHPPTPRARGRRAAERLARTVEIVDAGPAAAASSPVVLAGVARRPVAALDGRAPQPRRHAADQQRRRRVELRDARAGPAEPRLRPGQVGRRRLPRPPGRRRRDAGDARRRRAHVHGRRPAHLRRQRPRRSASPASWAARRRRSATPTTVGARSRWPGSIRSPSPARPRRLGLRSRGVGPLRAGRDPYGIDRAVARFVELLRETCPRPRRPRRARRRPRRPAARAPLGAGAARPRPTPCSAPRSRPRRWSSRLAPIGFEAVRRPGGVPRRHLPSWRPDCELEVDVIEEIARHVRLRAARHAPCRVRAWPAGSRPSSSPAAAAAPGALGLGISEAMPTPFLAPGDLDRAGLDARRPHDHQPARGRGERPAHVAAARAVQGGGLQRVAPLRRRRAVRDRPRLLRRRTGPLPDEREVLGVALAGREGPAAVRRAAGGGRRARAGRPDRSWPRPGGRGGRAGRDAPAAGAAS